jgi:NAD(P)-dependent dehydrogenase (short-subunit alcohol dehydrogenase family)
MTTVLITGASSGIGKATARKLLDEGYAVYGAARRVERMRDLERLGATALEMDVTEEDDVVAAVDRIGAEEGGIDVLVNNAGFGLYGAMEDTPLDEARRQFEVNLFGLARLTQLALPHMREQRAGKIVNMSSMGGKIYTPLGSWYHASKHALEGWSDCLRLELAPFGIDVIVIEPGAIGTEFGEVMLEPMLGRSGDTAYADLARGVAEATRSTYEDGNASPPSVIADVVSKALAADRPRTRYAAGRLARPLMALRKWGGDRVFDWAVTSQID